MPGRSRVVGMVFWIVGLVSAVPFGLLAESQATALLATLGTAAVSAALTYLALTHR